MLRKFLFSASILAAGGTLCYAQDSATVEVKPKPVITASADVYYRYNFSNPKKESEVYNNFTSFTNSQNSFELGMASVKLEHTIGKVGMVADLGFGRRAEEFSYNDEATRFAIKQLNVSYAPRENIKFTAGSWTTHVGYELVDAYANRNYSMSYMFSKGPFFHTGLKTDVTLGKSGLMLGVANPTDLKSASFSKKYIIGQYSFAFSDKVKAYLNYQGGKPADDAKLKQYDLVVTSTLGDKFSLGYNGTVASTKVKENGKYGDSESWWGSALYLNIDPTSLFGLTLRGEYFKDKNSLTDVFSSVDDGGSVFATTLSANFRISNLTIIPELRMDNASRDIFVKRSGATTKGTGAFLVAAVYKL